MDGDYGLAAVIEQTGDLACDGRHDRGVEQSIESGKEKRTDDYGDKDFHTGIDIAFSFLVSDGALCGYDNGIDFVFDFLKHIDYLIIFHKILLMKMEKRLYAVVTSTA